MADMDGEWNCVTRTPMGPQKSVLTVRSNGASFTGTNASPLGSLDILEGVIDGDTLHWVMETKVPFPLKLTARATVADDIIEGVVDAGAMGKMPMSGTRNKG